MFAKSTISARVKYLGTGDRFLLLEAVNEMCKRGLAEISQACHTNDAFDKIRI